MGVRNRTSCSTNDPQFTLARQNLFLFILWSCGFQTCVGGKSKVDGIFAPRLLTKTSVFPRNVDGTFLGVFTGGEHVFHKNTTVGRSLCLL